jgi:hypothetical protein
MDQLRDRVDALEHQLQTLHQQTRTLARRLRWWRGLAGGLLVLAVLTWALPAGTAQEDPRGGQKGLAQRVAALEDLLKHFSREGNEVFITGANLHIVNGLGATDTVNGVGNLIVGYNEPTGGPQNGSHNVIVGRFHEFSSYGGLVVGEVNSILGPFSSVTGGFLNRAAGIHSSISGGGFNAAGGDSSSIQGGSNNNTRGNLSSITGGSGNITFGLATWIGAGVSNIAGQDEVIEGGIVVGGIGNQAIGNRSAILGGVGNRTVEQDTIVIGGERNVAEGFGSVVSGGVANTALGIHSTISGGRDVVQDATDGWAAGSIGAEVSGSFRSP